MSRAATTALRLVRSLGQLIRHSDGRPLALQDMATPAGPHITNPGFPAMTEKVPLMAQATLVTTRSTTTTHSYGTLDESCSIFVPLLSNVPRRVNAIVVNIQHTIRNPRSAAIPLASPGADGPSESRSAYNPINVRKFCNQLRQNRNQNACHRNAHQGIAEPTPWCRRKVYHTLHKVAGHARPKLREVPIGGARPNIFWLAVTGVGGRGLNFLCKPPSSFVTSDVADVTKPP